ncbi:MAG TPA: SPOR domain-containing protein, partial [Steroidobacteraceae bacterium]|nr:SPOR domain-containing protein [Steroidobacteraceae bacterium]
VAVIVIPELLSGPGPGALDAAQDRDGSARAPLKTYTIDLATPGGQASPAAPVESEQRVVTERAPPQEELSAPVVVPDRAEPSTAPTIEPRAAATTTAPPASTQPAVESPQVKPTTSPPAPAPTRSEPAPQGAWAVQVGSFANRSSAEALANRLEQRGYRVFITQFTSDGRTLHRVRVGPMAGRDEADGTAKKLKTEGTTAAVVANR